ncbi:hypothetical protein COU89_01425 [Candidatus Roizmanbacteria bacterium CG10_big_fil_rev_8_21_14_0_10_45_7]|uniref:Glycosyltransferase RgtA/B/C/D-like domain-containing protein n=1 Tax=Candidatus Roizmanbacteria bacterium CG10_big_fil_rev_8_21_14_0_10_45_7 TaxID=1974854 RepID=A0A2M8KV68_9BACT|nr:MAG: hypothetical protein COU89_01425 [Candidatus Roizmanbacteria bacterium CG10_big_fil_rev_8_21_14_0_10_45_7]
MYYSLTDSLFWLLGLVSWLVVVVSCFIPGWLVLQKAKIDSALTRSLGAWGVGIALWAGQGFIFGYLHLRWLSYAYLGAAIVLAILNRSEFFKTTHAALAELGKLPKVVLAAIAGSVFFQIYGHIGSGLLTEKGIGYYFVNSADGMLHLGYIQSMIGTFPPIEPGLAGTQLVNYHYWGDLFMAELARVWLLPVNHLFFHYLPPILLILITLSFVQLLKQFSNKTATLLISLFLLTFGADAAFIFAQYFKHTWGASVPALDTGLNFIFNMPQVFGRLLLIVNLLFLTQWLKNRQAILLFIIAGLGASMVGFKIYYGIYFTIGFGFLSLFLVWQQLVVEWSQNQSWLNRIFKTFTSQQSVLLSWLLLIFLATIIYLPANRSAGGLLFVPLAWTKVFFSPDHYDYRDWWLRMQVYEAAHSLKNMTIYNTIAVAITLISVYGIRLLGLLPTKNIFHKLPTALLFFLIPTNFIFIIIGMLFFQSSGGLNIYNFLITPILSMIIFSSIIIGEVKDRFYKIILILLIVIFSLPRSIIQLKQYYSEFYSQHPTELISTDELELLTFIKNNVPPQAVIQADSRNQYDQLTPYVAFFADRPTYLGGQALLSTRNLDIAVRSNIVEQLFNQSDLTKIANQMREHQISYLYVTNSILLEKFLPLQKIDQTPSSLTILKQNKAGAVIGLSQPL